MHNPDYRAGVIRSLFFLTLLSLLSISQPGRSQPRDALELVGKAEFRYLLWSVYEARLYAESGSFRHFEDLPFVLALDYQRAFSADQIVRETEKQMRKLGFDDNTRLEQWMQSLLSILPEVNKGDTISLEVDRQGHSHFYLNEELLGSIESPAFSENFSAIWLSEHSTHPEFTAALTGESQ